MSVLHLDLLRTMLLIRRFEDRCVELHRAGRIRDLPQPALGHEAVAAGVSAALVAEDSVVSAHRDHAHAIARGVPVPEVMAEMFGRLSGCSRGRGGPLHLFDRSRRFVGGNATWRAGLPLAAGLALADVVQERPGVTACFLDDGSPSAAEFHEVVDLAVAWDLPLLVCCENVHQPRGRRSRSKDGRTRPVDGTDAYTLSEAAREAVAEIRAGRGPLVLDVTIPLHRTASRNDPIRRLVARMREEDAIDEVGVSAIDEAVVRVVEDSVTAAENGDPAPVTDLMRFVHSDTSVLVPAGAAR